MVVMSSPLPPPPEGDPDATRSLDPEYVPVSPLLPEDPPKIGAFWLDARLSAAAAGVAYTGHDQDDRPAIIILLSEGAAADAAARDRLAGVAGRGTAHSLLLNRGRTRTVRVGAGR